MKAPGRLAQDLFDPVPLPLIALIYTTAKFCIGEWAVGYHVQSTFAAESHILTYKSVLGGLERAAQHAMAGPKLAKLQKKLFEDIL